MVSSVRARDKCPSCGQYLNTRLHSEKILCRSCYDERDQESRLASEFRPGEVYLEEEIILSSELET